METSKEYKTICILFLLYMTMATLSFNQSEARRSMRLLKATHPRPKHHTNLFLRAAKKLHLVKRIDFPFDSSKDIQPYAVNSPLTLPPYESLAPISLPGNAPPYCTIPLNTPQTPSTTVPTPTGSTPSLSPPSPSSPFLYIPPPILPMQSPPSSPTIIFPGPPESFTTPNPPETVPSPTIIVPGPPQSISTPNPPETVPSPTIILPGPPQSIPTPNPPEIVPSPPYIEPSPPGFAPNPPYSVPSNPPSSVPSPFGFMPSPPVFQPPVVYPPPTSPPSPIRGPIPALWCVAKPAVPDPIIEEAMNYACGSGADCSSIQPNGPCFQPDSLFPHASYAFNSYWQRTKVAGGTCDFGGVAILVTVDPSFDGCHFEYY